jgi:hypothetical protein
VSAGGPVNGWMWHGTAPGAAAEGVSDEEDRARAAAEAWLRANPGGTALLEQAWLADITVTLDPRWEAVPSGARLASRCLPDGRVTWARGAWQR